ncbi:sodium channel protein Nach-like [Macrosteles quadrilineatus]|uniref:sodium channel protein Nach-like n=1 Tax=Macrosteles quadrilineatus TaxID=74068 RepID=UPI0023E28979|nr:sodium channel protein Nach-like [Macrosteles quadrilineatus]
MSVSEQSKSRVSIALSRVTREFCNKTSIHGLKYITEPNRTFGERTYWIVATMLVLVFALLLMISFFGDIINTPTRESILPHQYPTWLLPFPAITFCNSNLIFLSKAMDFIKSMLGGVPEDVNFDDLVQDTKMFLYVMGYNKDSPMNISTQRLFRLQHLLDIHNKSFEEAMYQLSQPCSEMLVSCTIRGQFADCLQIFETSKSHFGFCCSFNYQMSSQDNSPFIHVRASRARRNAFNQLDAFSAGPERGVSVTMQPAVNDYFASTDHSAGIKVLVHNYIDYPSGLEVRSTLDVGRETFVSITPKSRFGFEELRELSPTLRKCFFHDEIKLKYFAYYSFKNCLIEARMDSVIETCNCLPFNYPKLNNVKTCSLGDHICLKKFTNDWDNKSDSTITVMIQGSHIDCLEECTYFSYDISSTTGDLEAPQFNGITSGTRNASKNEVVVHLFYDDHITSRHQRQTSYAQQHQLAMVGGIFGLVLGCSVISIIEMIYFYTIRFLQYLRSSTLPHPALEETVSPQKIVKPPTLVRPYRPTTGNNVPATTDFIL